MMHIAWGSTAGAEPAAEWPHPAANWGAGGIQPLAPWTRPLVRGRPSARVDGWCHSASRQADTRDRQVGAPSCDHRRMEHVASSEDGQGRLARIRRAISELEDAVAVHAGEDETGLTTAAQLFQEFVQRLPPLSAAEIAEIALRGPWKDFAPDVPVDDSEGLLSVAFADGWNSITVVQGEDGKWYSVEG